MGCWREGIFIRQSTMNTVVIQPLTGDMTEIEVPLDHVSLELLNDTDRKLAHKSGAALAADRRQSAVSIFREKLHVCLGVSKDMKVGRPKSIESKKRAQIEELCRELRMELENMMMRDESFSMDDYVDLKLTAIAQDQSHLLSRTAPDGESSVDGSAAAAAAAGTKTGWWWCCFLVRAALLLLSKPHCCCLWTCWCQDPAQINAFANPVFDQLARSLMHKYDKSGNHAGLYSATEWKARLKDTLGYEATKSTLYRQWDFEEKRSRFGKVFHSKEAMMKRVDVCALLSELQKQKTGDATEDLGDLSSSQSYFPPAWYPELTSKCQEFIEMPGFGTLIVRELASEIYSKKVNVVESTKEEVSGNESKMIILTIGSYSGCLAGSDEVAAL